MPNLVTFRTACLTLALLAIAGCSSKKTAVYEHENFDDAGTFSRTYPVSDSSSCEAARRALLSQGYIITSSDPKMISGNKSFQQTGETHMQISFNVVCAADDASGKSSTVFANALQDRYALKKTNNSASLGVGVLGSVSMPIGSTDDSMVKVASETVASDKFYERFFTLIDNFMPPEAKKAANIKEAPKAALGVPEPAAPVPKPAALVEPAPAPSAPVEPARAPAVESSQPQPAPAPVEAIQAETAPVETAPAEAAPAEAAPVDAAPLAEPEPAPEPAL
jgi:hypothetical protein